MSIESQRALEGAPIDLLQPSDCGFGFALPSSRNSFYRDRRSALNKEFAGRYSCWAEYRKQVALPFERFERAAVRLGVEVVRDLCLGEVYKLTSCRHTASAQSRVSAQHAKLMKLEERIFLGKRSFIDALHGHVRPGVLSALLEEAKLPRFTTLFASHRVVILFAHFGRGQVEFLDGFASCEAVTSAVPEDFDGLLDLCVCHPKGLYRMLHRERPNMLIKFLPRRSATPAFWLGLYQVLFALLNEERKTYPRALLEAVRLLVGNGQTRRA